MADTTETEVGSGSFVNDNLFAEAFQIDPCVVVVSGPDGDDEIRLLAGAETYLPRETARALALEILRRLELPRG